MTAAAWADKSTWDSNGFSVPRLLGLTASFTTTEEVAATISSALERDTTLLLPILKVIASWYERRDSRAFGPLLDIKRNIDDVAPWFPLDRIAAEIHAQLPHVQPAHDAEHEPYPDELDNLAAQALLVDRSRSNQQHESGISEESPSSAFPAANDEFKP